MTNTIGFYKEHADAVIPQRMKVGDAGLDIYSIEEVTIQPGERKLVENGLRVVCPKGHYITFAPRSSMAFKYNVIPSHHNIMDENYFGNYAVLMHNRSDKPYTIEKGDRFCQIVLHKVPAVDTQEISEAEFEELKQASVRGEDGFGSSGK